MCPEDFEEFLAEVQEQLAALDVLLIDDLLGKEDRRAIFRAFHTLKGAAGLTGFVATEQIAHLAEKLLDGRKEDERLGPELVAGLRLAATEIGEIVSVVRAEGREPEVPQGVVAKLEEIGQVIPGRSGIPTKSLPTPPLGQLLIEKGLVTEVDVADAHTAQLAGDPRRLGEILVAQGKVSPEDILRALQRQKARDTKTASIEIPLTQIEEELGEIQKVLRDVLRDNPEARDAMLRLDGLQAELARLISRLTHRPLEGIWQSLKEVAETLSIRQGRPVTVRVSGGSQLVPVETGHAIKSAAIHAVRNAIAHAFEAPDKRKERGKPAIGSLQILAARDEDLLTVSIVDDGKGIDAEAVVRKAVELGHTTAVIAEGLSDAEKLDLIFIPGFSTNDKVTMISGRGVGMDAVRMFIRRVGGEVNVTTALGVGTTLEIRVPVA